MTRSISGIRSTRARATGIVLDPDEFYILASREAVSIPPDFAAEMMPFNPMVGEFRVHYAGFFDPGFGHETGQGRGARAVLEVRSREVPFVLEHGQTIGRLVFERLTDTPPQVYGQALGFELPAAGAEAVEALPRALVSLNVLVADPVLKLCHFVNTALQNCGGATEIALQREAVRSL